MERSWSDEAGLQAASLVFKHLSLSLSHSFPLFLSLSLSLSSTYGKEGFWMASPAPRRYIKLEIQTSTRMEGATGRVHSIVIIQCRHQSFTSDHASFYATCVDVLLRSKQLLHRHIRTPGLRRRLIPLIQWPFLLFLLFLLPLFLFPSPPPFPSAHNSSGALTVKCLHFMIILLDIPFIPTPSLSYPLNGIDVGFMMS